MAYMQDKMPVRAKLATGVLFAGVVMLGLHGGLKVAWPPVLPASWWDWLYNALEIAATVLCASRAVARRHERAAWAMIALGMALFSAGDMYYSVVFADVTNVPFPSWADALYLGFYPPVYVGIGLLLRSRARRLPAGLWMDGLIGALAVAALGAALVLGAVISDTHGAVLTVATNLAYPLADLLLLGILTGIIALTGWRVGAAWLVIAAGLAVFTVTDSIYLIQAAKGTYVNGGLLDVGWPGGMLLVAVAAWVKPARSRIAWLEGWPVFTIPAVAAIACVGLEFYDHYERIPVVAHVLATVCLLTVIVRLGMSFAENLRMLRASRSEAVTDALTGLGNRRALGQELDARLAEHPVVPFVLAYYDLDGFKVYNDTFGHQAGDALLARLGQRVAADLPAASVFRMGGDEFCLIVSEADGGTRAAARAADALSASGAGFTVGCSYGTVRVPTEALDADAAMLLADARMYDHKGQGRPSAASESQGVLLRALAERNTQLGQHNDDVAELVDEVGFELGLAPAELQAIRRAAELHDVGKLAIPDAILNKAGPLDDAEWEFMRRHTIVGERIVSSATSLRDVAPIVRSSHERWDGGGYPDGLAGEEIPLGARIVAVCDAYDAMTTTRPYRAATSEQAALAELRRCAGAQFDPTVVAAFEGARERAAGSRTPQATAA